MGVNTLRINLSDADIRALIKGGADEDAAMAAYRLCRRIDGQAINDEERKFTDEILRLVVQSAADRVKQALSVTLRSSPNIPPDVAFKLASDIDTIALPILEHSPSLSDEDLVEILKAAEPARQLAIARRPTLSEDVTDAIAKHAGEPAINSALRNEGARFSDSGLRTAIDRFPTSEEMATAMIDRPIIPLIVAEAIAQRFTGQIFDRLVERHALPPQLAIDIANSSRERASIDLISQAGMQADLQTYVQQLNLNGKLTPSFVLRAMCQGEVRLVEYCFAELASLPHHKAWLLVHDSGHLGLRAIYDRAGLPPNLYPAFRAAIEVLHETEFDGSIDDRQRFKKRMIERVLTRYQSIPEADIDYLLEKLDHKQDSASTTGAAA